MDEKLSAAWEEGFSNGRMCAENAAEEGEPLDVPPVRNRKEWANGFPDRLSKLAETDTEFEAMEEKYVEGCEDGWAEGVKAASLR